MEEEEEEMEEGQEEEGEEVCYTIYMTILYRVQQE